MFFYFLFFIITISLYLRSFKNILNSLFYSGITQYAETSLCRNIQFQWTNQHEVWNGIRVIDWDLLVLHSPSPTTS